MNGSIALPTSQEGKRVKASLRASHEIGNANPEDGEMDSRVKHGNDGWGKSPDWVCVWQLDCFSLFSFET